jgi:PD-(D/E)XK endonuclease
MRRGVKKLGSKLKGEYAELFFAAQAAKRGLTVLFPNGDSARYDFVLDTGKNLYKIQVKSSTTGEYSISHGSTSKKSRHSYSNIDYFAFVDLNTNDIYLIPLKKFKKGQSNANINAKNYPMYKNNWQLLKI